MNVSEGRGSMARLVLVAFLFLLSWTMTEGQVSRDFGRTVRDVVPLDEKDAEEFLAQFLSSRGGLDSILDASLIHCPRNGKKESVPVRIFSGWAGQTLLLRVEIASDGVDPDQRFLFRGGKDPAGWGWSSGGSVEILEASRLFQPLVPGMDLTAFDLTAPYLDWVDVTYEGAERVSNSPSHWFRFEPPAEWVPALELGGVSSVRVALDARFDAPVQVEYLGNNDEVVRVLEVRSFKKISETWIVRRLEAFDERTRDRTELRVEDADVELRLPLEVFQSEALNGDISL